MWHILIIILWHISVMLELEIFFFQASFTGVPEKGSPPCYGGFLTILMLCNFFSSASSCSIGKIALQGFIIEKISIHRQPWSFEERCSIGGWGWSCWNFEAFELCKKHSRQLNTTPPFSFFSKLSQPRLSFLKFRTSYKQIVGKKIYVNMNVCLNSKCT